MKYKLQILLILVAGVLAGLLYYLPNGEDQTAVSIAGLKEIYIGPKVEPIVVENSTIEFPYTDDLEGETIIIKTDKKTYYDESGSEVYISVTNSSHIQENAGLIFYFSGDKDDGLDSLEILKNGKWEKLEIFREEAEVNVDVLGKALEKRNTIPEHFKIKGSAEFTIPEGETVYLRSNIAYKPNTEGEFWIEALGNKGSYGLLDPFYSSVQIFGNVVIKGGVGIGRSVGAAGEEGGCVDNGIEQVGTASSDTFDADPSPDLPHTTGECDTLLMVGISITDDGAAQNPGTQTVSSVTFNGDSLTQACFGDSDDDANVYIYYRVNPDPSTSANVTVNLSPTPAKGAIVGAVSYRGTDTVTPLGSCISASDIFNPADPLTVTATSSVGELVFDVISGEDTAFTANGSQTVLWDLTGPNVETGGASTKTGAANVTMSWDLDATNHEVLVAVPIKPAP